MDLKAALAYFSIASINEVSLVELKAIYRRLAKEKHPDQGGTNNDFVSLRRAFVLLKNELEKFSPSNGKSSIITQEIVELNKDELLSKYYKDTEKLQNQLQLYEKSMADQQIILGELASQVKSLVNGFNQEKQNLQNKVRQETLDLEKRLNGETFWKRVFFFLPKMSRVEFWNEYNSKIQYYTEQNNNLDTNFFKEMLGTYGQGLNSLKDKITEKKS